MNQIEIPVPPTTFLANAEAQIEDVCRAEGLKIALKSSLATYSGSIHWHLKRGTGPGTLEITLWPNGRRLWLSIHRRRDAPWVEPTARLVARRLLEYEESGGEDAIVSLSGLGDAGPGRVSEDHDRVLAEQCLDTRSR
jgi:hypothetical protein